MMDAKQKMVIRETLGSLKNEDGVITAPDVVDAARPKNSPLHPHFNWDDRDAAERYRQEQARALIRVFITVTTGRIEPEREFVSLTVDRAEKRGGYRMLADVVAEPETYASMRHDAITLLRGARNRYRRVKELKAVWAAVDALGD